MCLHPALAMREFFFFKKKEYLEIMRIIVEYTKIEAFLVLACPGWVLEVRGLELPELKDQRDYNGVLNYNFGL